MPKANETYASYLFRFQCIQRDNRRTWIASARSTATGEVCRFPNLDAVLQFLRDEFGSEEEAKDLDQSAIRKTENRSLTE
jgi:hypothetical protein